MSVLVAQRLNELDVLGLIARLAQHTQVGLTAVKGLGGLTQTTGKTVVHQGLLEHLLKSILNAHSTALGGRGSLGLLDLDIDRGLLNVRHDTFKVKKSE